MANMGLPLLMNKFNMPFEFCTSWKSFITMFTFLTTMHCILMVFLFVFCKKERQIIKKSSWNIFKNSLTIYDRQDFPPNFE